ncbi:FAD-binding oxidoreductase [Erysipelothrix urinaevulpis]|uniref:NAD(P)/FAD-dependent oxidoreductase n=1 Tax=Erysipelothrix urinaevulpis TaxID=2683717 RepID=UPI00135C373C|nr:FAD-dependent oxidoreductase [Erysipelothrix urinaevulpis]
MKRIAIVGGGVVGATAAFYLSKNKEIELMMFDDGELQATSAAVGIVCPWLSQRRNQFWYQLVQDGAEFYDTLICDMKNSDFYEKIGGLYINEKMEDKIYNLGKKRQKETSKIGEIKKVGLADDLTPPGFMWESGVYVEGAARVDGQKLVQTLKDKAINQGMIYKNEWANTQCLNDQYSINGYVFDEIIFAAGAWLKESLNFLSHYSVDVRKQKGQLIEFDTTSDKVYPVIMPKGEIDFLFDQKGSLVVGASHENDYVDEAVDWHILNELKEEASRHLPSLNEKDIDGYRVGIRAHSSDYTPYYGEISQKGIYVASGLGSSGLTSGPIIGYRLAQLVENKDSVKNEWFNAKNYVVLNK